MEIPIDSNPKDSIRVSVKDFESNEPRYGHHCAVPK